MPVAYTAPLQGESLDMSGLMDSLKQKKPHGRKLL